MTSLTKKWVEIVDSLLINKSLPELGSTTRANIREAFWIGAVNKAIKRRGSCTQWDTGHL